MQTRRARDAEFTDFAALRMPQLYRTAWLLCGDRQRAEDLVQDTLIKVYAAWGPRIENPIAYAQTTLSRTWISHLRRRSSHEPPTSKVPETLSPEADQALRLTLVAALAKLNDTDRAIVVLRHLDDVSTADVARQLNLSQGAVRKRLMRALTALQDILDTPFHELVTGGNPHDAP